MRFMLYRIKNSRTYISAWLILTLCVASLTSTPSAHRQNDSTSSTSHNQSISVPIQPIKKDWSHEKLLREAWVWHQLNRQRVARNHRLGVTEVGAAVINTDIDDISVLQDDGTLVTPQNLFDLNGRSVQFTPAGSGYTITSFAAPFDTNLGTKLDLTVAPAVNPKIPAIPEVEPGDDAYITQDLGFSFNFYGVAYTSIAISSNGNLTFRPGGVSNVVFDNDTVNSGESLSDLQQGLPRIAPYWHDLDARASKTQGNNGVFIRRESDRVLVTWNNIPDFPNNPGVDTGSHRFQVTLFKDGRIIFTYELVQLTSTALVGLSPGSSSQLPTLLDLSDPASGVISGPLAELFSTSTRVDLFATVRVFYATHPNRDLYDFIYLLTDFNFNLGGGFAYYLRLRNNVAGLGQPVFDGDPNGVLGSQRLQGILNLNNIDQAYPELPTTRFLGANHALSIMGQEQGHRWLADIKYPGADPKLLLGRDDTHWSFFLNTESTMSTSAARRSSALEGNAWRDNENGSFTSVSLIDGFSRLDHYLMGLRPSAEVPDTFIITNASGGARSNSPQPNVTVSGSKQAVKIDQIIQANGARNPDVTTAPKSFRAAVILLVRSGTQPSAATLNKVARYRLAWESYFAQSTDYVASLSTGLADQTTSRVIAATSAASYLPTLSPAGIAALFGSELTSGATEAATAQPLPITLAGTQVLINGTPAPLFFASPQQINFQVPRTTPAITSFPFSSSVPSSTATIEVISNGKLIRAGSFQLAPAVPAIFTFNQSGTGLAAALDAFTFTGPPFSATRPNGEPNIIALFCSGLGADATDVDGNVNASVQVTIDASPVTVAYAGRAPGFTGLNQLNVVLPAGLSSGTHTIVVSRNGIQSNQATITLR